MDRGWGTYRYGRPRWRGGMELAPLPGPWGALGRKGVLVDRGPGDQGQAAGDQEVLVVASVDAPELTALQERARLRAAARTGGADRLRGHIVCDGLVRIFKPEGIEVVALQGLDLLVDRGELMVLVGASGSGKSTLLTILSGLECPPPARRLRTDPHTDYAASGRGITRCPHLGGSPCRHPHQLARVKPHTRHRAESSRTDTAVCD